MFLGLAGSLSISHCEPTFSSKQTQKNTTADESVASGHPGFISFPEMLSAAVRVCVCVCEWTSLTDYIMS